MARRGNGSNVGLALHAPEEARLWEGIFATQGISAAALPAAAGREGLLAAASEFAALVVDVPVLLAAGTHPAAFAAAAAERASRLALFVRLPERTGISVPERAWARRVGIASLLPGSTVAAWRSSVASVLQRVLERLGKAEPDLNALGAHLAALVRRGEEPRPGPVKDAHAEAQRLEGKGVDPMALLTALRSDGGVAVKDRSHWRTTYRDCFVASEAVDWIDRHHGIGRPLATEACEFLWRTGRIHHVLRDAAFADDYLFFRFGPSRAELERIDLADLQARMRFGGSGAVLADGLAIGDRSYMGKTYPRCFVGSEAVDWLARTCGLTRGAAEGIGQSLVELGALHHVVDEHGFIDGNFFYRFREDEPRA